MGSWKNLILPVLAVILTALPAAAQRADRETYTGTIVSYGSGFNTRTTTSTFTLVINKHTSDERAQRLLGLLQEDNENALLDAVRQEDVGTFSIGSRIGPRVNVVRERMIDGKVRVFAAFERWKGFGELRGGYRSLDYPFSVIEMYIDPRTGRGDGTFVAAAQVHWKKNKKTGEDQIEIENFATFPAKLMGVTLRGRRLS